MVTEPDPTPLPESVPGAEPAWRGPAEHPSGQGRTRLKLAAAGLTAMAALALAGRSIRDYAAAVGGIDWLPEPFAALVNPPLPPPPTHPELVPELQPQVAFPLHSPTAAGDSGDVPAWREPRPGAGPWNGPIGWQDPADVLWRTPTPGPGTSTPIVVGPTVLLTAAEGDKTLRLVAYAAATGVETWRRTLADGDLPGRHPKTSDAASTPCAAGGRVHVAWAAGGRARLAAFDLDGTPAWKVDLGPFTAGMGFASSPAACGGLVIVAVDNGSNGYLVAVRADSGVPVWRRRRPAAGDGSYSSPIVRAGERPAVLIAGLGTVEAYDLATGERVWSVAGLAGTSAVTPALDGDLCVATSGYPERVMLGLVLASGGVPPPVAWQDKQASLVPYVPSPCVREGRLYVLHDDGLAHCRDLASGRVLWKTRVGGAFTASPLLLGDRLLCADETGRCVTLAAADGATVAEAKLPDGCFATPVAARDRLFIRTTAELVCIGRP